MESNRIISYHLPLAFYFRFGYWSLTTVIQSWHLHLSQDLSRMLVMGPDSPCPRFILLLADAWGYLDSENAMSYL
jgi:hypothetical protein